MNGHIRWEHYAKPIPVGLGLFVAMLLLYVVGAQTWYTGDDLQYATVIESAATGKMFYHPSGSQTYLPPAERPPARPLTSWPFNPRYPIEWITSLATVQLWQLVGWQGKIILPVLVLRGLVGALGIFAFYGALQRLTKHTGIALLTSIGIGTSVAYWTYSTHLDQTINMIACVAVAFYSLLRHFENTRSRWHWLMLGMLVLATLYNFTAVLTAGVFILASGIGELGSWRNNFFTVIRRGILYGFGVFAVFMICLVVFVTPSNLFSSAYWSSATFQGHPEYQVAPAQDTVRGILGFVKSQINLPGATGSLQSHWNQTNTQGQLWLVSYYGAWLVLMTVPLLILFWYRAAWREHVLIVSTVATWMLTHSVFNLVWDPGYNKYWILPLMGWWMLTGLVLCLFQTKRIMWGAVALMCFISLTINLITQFLPQSRAESNTWLGLVGRVHTEPNTLFISAGHPVDFYLTYFAERNVLAVPLLFYHFNGNQQQVKQVINTHQAAHRADKGVLYVYGIDNQSDTERAEFLRTINAQELKPAFTFPELVIYQVVR